MATNLYGKSCTPNLGGVQDFYTKAEVNQFLGAKANVSTTYTRAYIDGELATLSSGIASLDTDKIDQTQLDSALTTLQGTIESGVAATYATLADTYTKNEVDSLIAAIDLDPADYIRSAPTTTSQNTIYPGTADAIALTVRGSSNNPIVTQWLDSSSNRIGYITNSGSTVLENKLVLGRLAADGDYALDMRSKRISNVSTPVDGGDAVNYSFLKSYVTDYWEEVARDGLVTPFTFDGGVYDPEDLSGKDKLKLLKSLVSESRPLSNQFEYGELALNYSAESIGLYALDSGGNVRKLGPVHIGSNPPSPVNNTSLSEDELWIDTSNPDYHTLKYYFNTGAEDGWKSTSPPLSQGSNIEITNESGSISISLSENVDISGTLDVTNVATFDTKISIGAAEPSAEAEVGWNTDKGTLDIGLLNGVISPYGQDVITLCRNNTASSITKGEAVMFTGTIGNSGLLTVAPMVADGTYPGYVFFGVAAQSIAAGADGYIRSFGEIKGVNTDIDEGGVDGQWAEGDILWCDPATPGGFTKTEPLAPNLKLPVAAVVSVGNNGILFVRWDTGRRLQDLHDVDANGATTDGDLLQYNASASRWEHVTDVTLPGRVVINGTDITESARDIEESRLIRKNATLSIGVAGTVPFGVGPVIPPGMSLVGIGPDAYNVIDIYSGSVC